MNLFIGGLFIGILRPDQRFAWFGRRWRSGNLLGCIPGNASGFGPAGWGLPGKDQSKSDLGEAAALDRWLLHSFPLRSKAGKSDRLAGCCFVHFESTGFLPGKKTAGPSVNSGWRLFQYRSLRGRSLLRTAHSFRSGKD